MAKRYSVWKKALKLHSDILCIQETHFFLLLTPSVHYNNFPPIFMALAPNKQKSVLIATKDSVAFTPLRRYIQAQKGDILFWLQNSTTDST